MNIRQVSVLAVAIATFGLTACSSAPDWDNMSQAQITAWKDAGFSADAAEDWAELGATASQAKAWLEAGFDEDDAEDWIEEKFTAEEAKAWKEGGFDLSEAVRDRKKGLQPIR